MIIQKQKQINYWACLFGLFAIVSFILGFYLNEIPAGSGGLNGDINYVKKSLNIFNNNDLDIAINLFRESSNRTPLIYTLQKLLNPFFSNIDHYRITVFIISIISPVFLYLAFKLKFNNLDKNLLFILTSIIFLNPFFRNSAFWGLEENYAYLTFFLSLIFFEKIKSSASSTKSIDLIMLAFFSSLCIYFDQKFLVVPLYFFLNLIFSKLSNNSKIIFFISYCIFAIPFLYLIYLWRNIFPTNIYKIEFHFNHLIYAASIISFYILPLIFFTKNVSKENFKKCFLNINYLTFIIFLNFYILYIFNFTDNSFITNLNDGGGIIKKITHILFDDLIYKKTVIYITFLISCSLIYYFIDFKLNNLLIILYFFLIAFFAKPYYQEYFDPLLMIVYFFLFNKEFLIKFKFIIFFYFYMLIYLICSIFYYNILN